MTVKKFAEAHNEIQTFRSANQDVADYQSLLAQIWRMRITNKTIYERP